MANKRYYWLKLKEDFFKSKEIKKLRTIAGGDTFVIIYLKMQLISLKNEGKLFFDGIDDDFSSELALEIDEDVENVKVTIAFLERCGLLECTSSDEYFLPVIPEITGSESESAKRVRNHRANKALQCNSNVTRMQQECNKNVTPEIEKDKEKDKDKEKEIEKEESFPDKSENPTPKPKIKKISFGEYQHIKLTQEQYDKLCEDYGENFTKDYIRKMDEWLQIKGKNPYKDFNLALRNWLNKDNIKKRSSDDEFFYRYSDPDDRPF